jgi:hypothetical protein
MDTKVNIKQTGYVAGNHKVTTQAIKVTVVTDDYEIDGFMHIKPGSYQSRVSDLLNIKEQYFIPITSVTYRSLRFPNEPSRTADTLILRLDTIKMVVPWNNEDTVSVPINKPVEGMMAE